MDLIITGVKEPGEPRFFFGVNADLAGWIHKKAKNKRSLVRKGLLDKKVKLEQLDDVLGSRNSFDRRLASWKVINALWNFHSELGPYPVAHMLEGLEDKRAFHANYREHALLHQLMVYILGLYLFEHCKFLSEALLKEIEPHLDARKRKCAEKEFLRRWLVAATAHDIGYVLESPTTDYTNRGAHLWEEVARGLDAIFKRPLSRVPSLRIDAATEGSLYQDNRITVPTILGLERLLNDAKLQSFDSLAEGVHLGVARRKYPEPILKRYYKFAQENDGARGKLRDHGVTSAIIIIALLNAYHKVIQDLTRRHAEIQKDSATMLDYCKTEAAAAKKAVRAACGAIALHNVNLELWKSGNGNAAENPLADDLVVKGLGPGPLLFALHTLQKQGTRRAPLAFFLRLCDGLHGPPPKFKTPILYN